MNVLYLLLPLALALAGAFVIVFVWAVRNGQFDDLETPSHRVLFDDSESPSAAEPDETTPDSRGRQKTT